MCACGLPMVSGTVEYGVALMSTKLEINSG